VDVPYEPSERAEVTIDTAVETPDSAAERIVTVARRLDVPAPRHGGSGDGAVIWITGPPGSGKTTLTLRLAAALAADGVEARILEWAALRAFVFHTEAISETEEETAHRALAYTAKLLADAGFTVVVDAAAPRRAWRALARVLAGTFAEVQLVCPTDICLDRERAVRWGRQAEPHPTCSTPDFAVEYEYSLGPDLLLDTATRSEWTACEDLLRLARRLTRRRRAG
jgi:adenylylsulfate kinase-like enzyme